ncbi:tetratricopeptide repeat protein [Lentisphaera marina]|uniref:tetratricopeptide repeat protein n=1 Tax=Lentisphaera marina TaxID=1111041 RepID=UPI00236680FE|nr:tetratricopeptide repeat protein [Lentisphaera marina]MDD7984252.1 tetratricopeptide repeat protein [Lentisphaera marina]
MNNKAILALLSSLGVIILCTLLLLKKDVRPSTIKQQNTIPYEVQSATAQGMVSSGKFLFANKIFENSYSHFKDNPAFINSYTDSLLAAKEVDKAIQITVESLKIYPLNKELRIKLARCLILKKKSPSAYTVLTELPLFTQKEADFLSLIIMSTPNKSGLESLMGKMKNFSTYQSFFPKHLVEHSPNSNFIKKSLTQ